MRGILRRPLSVAAVGGLAVILLGASVVLGATIAANGGPVTAVRTKTASDQVAAVNTAFPLDVAGAWVTVDVPANQQAMLLITFSSETTCFGTVPYSGCFIHVLVDGSLARPGNVEFDATNQTPSADAYTANSMQFVASPVGPGTHYVKVQMWTDPNAWFALKVRTLTVLRAQV